MSIGSTNSQFTNYKQIPSTNSPSKKIYDLEERTLTFATMVRALVKKLPRTISNIEDIEQLVRSSGSVGANYIEANESLSKKDFVMRAKISRKEAKESRFWLQLLEVPASLSQDVASLVQESTELVKIFNAIIEKSK